MVIISVDRWTNCCNEIGKESIVFLIFLFVFALLIKDFWQTGREKKRKKSIGGVVYIDLHSPGVCRQAG